jgi:hypothetical protein
VLSRRPVREWRGKSGGSATGPFHPGAVTVIDDAMRRDVSRRGSMAPAAARMDNLVILFGETPRIGLILVPGHARFSVRSF